MPLILSRRSFVSSTLATGAGLLLAERLVADPYHPLPAPRACSAPRCGSAAASPWTAAPAPAWP
ncbi:MAG: hypothetical protein IPK12_06960 [Gemmatimonadetes bacterium]|nr:hypothetical protein [Gemmatimonadota bacterium]